MRVAGVDGCRAGWVVALASPTGVDVAVLPRFADVGALVEREAVAAVALDMPVGLPEAGPRACDRAARAVLGRRGCTVFAAPARPMLGATSWDGVSGMSRQTFHLLPKIREVDAWITPARQGRVVESHPELAFARLAGAPVAVGKRTPAGRDARLELLGLDPPAVPRGARLDDVLDALALVHTARRIAAGAAERLGDGARDARGLRMEIAW